VIAIEKDRTLAAALGTRKAERGTERLVIVAGDALAIDWSTLVPPSALRAPRFKIAGNIPYYITSPLIEKALSPPLPERVVFLVQAEVADRLAAAPGSKVYGALSVGVQAVARVERLFRVPAGAFRPPPKVASAVVRLTPLVPPLVGPGEQTALRRFVTACFTRRRKQLRNVVAHAAGVSLAVAAAGLAQLGIDPTARPEELGVAEYLRLLRWRERL
jgi:16S rRNA (adenine1518-N6/adenine1519-N6)-dimethyltransferase